ncbi:MAG: amino acid ABC transporter permease [Candidatus Promineifilaceae bacterium]
MATVEQQARGQRATNFDWRTFPWWLVIIFAFLLLMGYFLIVGVEYNRAFVFIRGELGSIDQLLQGEVVGFIGEGISLTIYTTLVAFLSAMVLGLLAGLGRISQNILIRNLAITYVEFVRGVPTLVLIFTLAYVIVPAAVDLIGLEGRSISNNSRAIAALAIIYGAYLAEVFRAGIESIAHGQMEAARSLGMTAGQAMRHIILPQAVRNILPALGNDFIAMLKDSSLVSVLAVRDITQLARLHAGSSFRFRESYLVLTFLYLSMTIALSLLLRWYERRLRQDGR